MDLFFCFTFGCPTKISQLDDGSPPRVCPRCHNAAVIQAKSRTWFEFCFIPLIPFKSSRIYLCGICQWQAPLNGSYQPPPVGQNPYGGAGQYQQPGYGYPPQGYGPK